MRTDRGRRVRRLVLGMAVAGVPAVASVAQAADSWSITIGVRETGTSAAIGADGGTTGGIEWVNLDGQSIVADGLWHQYTWNFGADPITNFSGGNGVLSSATNKGVLENIRILNSGGNVGGAINLRIDNIVNTVGGVPTTVAGFETSEGFTTGLTSSQPMFREPIFSGSTLANLSTGLNSTLVSTIPHDGAQSMAARWSFVPDGSTSRWLRLSTASGASGQVKPNPTIDFTSGNTLTMWMRAGVVNPSGTRAFGVDVSSNQGTGIDWNKVAAPQTSGGAGLTFAFARATRGGTSGTSTTGAMRVDDTTFTYNITNAKAAGMLVGPYHFGRPDMWTAGDVNGLTDAPGTVGTPEDEARHYLEVAGKYMKVGYMRPVYDLEDGGAEQNVNQMSNFVHRFANTLMKYKGPVKIIVYAGQSYSVSEVNSSVSTYPLWRPQWPSDPDPWAADPSTVEANYGAWDPPGTGNPMPWSFWQYNSPDVYIPGIGGVSGITHNDIDVAHGDVNFVKGFLIQGTIWDGSSSAVWATGANWDTNLEPGGTTEVLFDLGIPGTGATITLSAGRAASGVYFADNYTLTGGSLTLNDGRIDVDAVRSATISTDLSTPNGFRKVGLGSLTQTGGTSNVTGIAQVLQGTMRVNGGSITVSGNLLVNPELTQFDKSLVAPLPVSASEISNSSLTINGGSVSAAAAFVGGSDTAAGANGTLTMSSGSLSVTGALKIWNSALPLVDSKVNFSGGSMSVGSLDTNGDLTSFNWSGGTLTIGADNSSSLFNALGTGSAALVKTGTGVVTLGVANTYSGSTIVNGGTLRVGVNNATSATSDMSVAGGTFDLNGFNASVRTLFGSGPITLGTGNLTVSPVGVAPFAGTISGSGTLSKNGTGALVLSGVNTYTGATNINAGRLSLGNDNGLSSSTAVTVSAGATFDVNGRTSTVGSVAGAGSVQLSFGALTAGANNTSTLFSGTISGTGTFTKTGNGSMTLSGANSYTGTTTINGGTLATLADNNLGNGSNGLTITTGTFSAISSYSTARNWSVSSSGSAISVGTGMFLTSSGIISGGGGIFDKRGAGTLVLTGNSNYTGYLNLAVGTVKLGVNNALPPGSRLDAISGAGSLDMAGFSQTLVSANALSINNSAGGLSVLTISGPSAYTLSGSINGNIAVVYGAGANVTPTNNNTYTGGTTVNGIVSVSADNRLGNSAGLLTIGGGSFVPTASFSMSRPIDLAGSAVFQPFATTLTASGVISGSGPLYIFAPGKLVLSGANTFNGGVGMANGEISVSADNNLGDAAGPLTFSGTYGSLGTTASFSTGRGVTLQDATGDGTFNIASGTTLTAAGVISGSGNLAKIGTGTLRVSALNTYTGLTKVNAGMLQLVQSSRTSSGLNIADGATVAMTPRTSGAKTLQVGTLDLATSGTLDLADNDLVVDLGNFGGFSYIQGLVISGFGNPSGPGITSSTSDGSQILALFDNSLVGALDWNGGAIGANAVVGKYTYFGDANIDGQVTGDDYGVIDANLDTTPPVGLGWLSGDMNLDGSVTGDDYGVLDANLGLGVGNPLTPSVLSVPEPGVVGVLGLAVAMRRRRRGRN